MLNERIVPFKFRALLNSKPKRKQTAKENYTDESAWYVKDDQKLQVYIKNNYLYISHLASLAIDYPVENPTSILDAFVDSPHTNQFNYYQFVATEETWYYSIFMLYDLTSSISANVEYPDKLVVNSIPPTLVHGGNFEYNIHLDYSDIKQRNKFFN